MEKQTDWNIITVVVSVLTLFLAVIGSDVYAVIKRSADQQVFMSDCVKSHSPTDCAVAYKATK